MKTLEEFKIARREALMSLDEKKIRQFLMDFNGVQHSTDPKIFWGGVHKAITGATDLPIEFRRKSKEYLDAQGLRSLDDGDL